MVSFGLKNLLIMNRNIYKYESVSVLILYSTNNHKIVKNMSKECSIYTYIGRDKSCAQRHQLNFPLLNITSVLYQILIQHFLERITNILDEPELYPTKLIITEHNDNVALIR